MILKYFDAYIYINQLIIQRTYTSLKIAAKQKLIHMGQIYAQNVKYKSKKTLAATNRSVLKLTP